MASLYEALNNAHDGEAIALLGREFELTSKQTDAAVTALLPAISAGLKQSTATVNGLGNLFAVMGQQKDLNALYDDAETALGPEGLAAGNDVLSVIFGSPDVSQAVVDQAQKFSGVDSSILKKLLPVLADCGRRSHAKWIRIHVSRGTHPFTGSAHTFRRRWRRVG
jgi:hypothetical protein